jgi:Flp pilus assembly protein TadG
MSKKNNETGQSLVELGISLMVILTLLAGAVEFSIALFQFVQLRDAAQEGALYGSFNPDDEDGIRWRVRAASQSPIDLSDTSLVPDSDIVVEYNDGAKIASEACEGDGVSVTITFDHTIALPLVGPIIGSNTIPLTASVTDTILQPVCP